MVEDKPLPKPFPSQGTPEEIEAYKASKGFGPDQVFAPKPVATFVKDKAVAERMLAGTQRHLNSMPKLQAELRVMRIKVSGGKLKGVIRGAKRRQRRESFKGSEGFEGSARATRKATGPSEKVAARQRAKEFNSEHGGQHGNQDSQEAAADS